MALINFTLQGKGGVGKSFVSALLAQYYQSRGMEPVCFDTDPVNQTLAGYTGLRVSQLKIFTIDEFDQVEMDPRAFDGMMDGILSLPEDGVAIVDNGAATFLPLMSYMFENDVIPMIQDHGHELRLHCVLAGGQAYDDTLVGLDGLLRHFPDAPVVAWLNEYFGRLEKAGKSFEESKLFKENRERFHALVRLSAVRRETFGHDMEIMLSARQRFADAVEDDAFNIMARQRLKIVWRAYAAEMDKAQL